MTPGLFHASPWLLGSLLPYPFLYSSAERIMSTNEQVPKKGEKIQSFKQRRTFGEFLFCVVQEVIVVSFLAGSACARVCTHSE